MNLIIKQIPNGRWKENAYIVSDINNNAIILDPGFGEKDIISFIKLNNLNVSAILNTHAHYDHIGSVKNIKDKFTIPFYLHSKDEKLLKSANLYSTLFDGIGSIKIPSVDYYLDQIDILSLLDNFSIQVISTPGHTWGSVSFLIDDCLFTGDTLFEGNIGRVDLPGGHEQTLNNTLMVLSKLPIHTIIYPGHGTSSTIGHELKYNKSFIQALK